MGFRISVVDLICESNESIFYSIRWIDLLTVGSMVSVSWKVRKGEEEPIIPGRAGSVKNWFKKFPSTQAVGWWAGRGAVGVRLDGVCKGSDGLSGDSSAASEGPSFK